MIYILPIYARQTCVIAATIFWEKIALELSALQSVLKVGCPAASQPAISASIRGARAAFHPARKTGAGRRRCRSGPDG